MPDIARPKGLFSPQESDYLQRYYVRVYDAIVQNSSGDSSLRSDIEEKARAMVSSSLYKVFLESVMLRLYLEREVPGMAMDITTAIGRIEKDDGLVSEFVKAWVPENRFELFLNNLLLYDKWYPVDDRVARWSMVLKVLHRDMRNAIDSGISRAEHRKTLRLLREVEREFSRLPVSPIDCNGPRMIRGRSIPRDRSPQVEDDEFEAALCWLMDGRRSKHLIIDLPVKVKERPKMQFTMRWDFNIPALLLTTLTQGFPCDREAPSRPLQQASWHTIVDLIVERFEAYDLAALVEVQYDGHTTSYNLDLLNVPKKDERGKPLSPVEREEEARRMWDEQFTMSRHDEIISVQNVSEIVRKIESTLDWSKESGGKKSVLTSAVNHMKALGLVEGVPEGRRGTVRITDLGQRAASFTKVYKIDDVDAIALRGRQIFPRKARSRPQGVGVKSRSVRRVKT